MNALFIAVLFLATSLISCDAFTNPSPTAIRSTSRHERQRTLTVLSTASASGGAGRAQESSSSSSSSSSQRMTPKTFREGEVMGLRLMQDGRHEEALKAFQQAMKLPGSRRDILRTPNVSGPSPVGGSLGGTEMKRIQTLDEFEYQAAHYNMACAHASLGNAGEAVANLKKAFEYGFDNYATVRADPDLRSVRDTAEFARLMEEADPRKFNPFGVFGK